MGFGENDFRIENGWWMRKILKIVNKWLNKY